MCKLCAIKNVDEILFIAFLKIMTQISKESLNLHNQTNPYVLWQPHTKLIK